MNIGFLAIGVGAVFYWAFHRMVVPQEKRYASKDFVASERLAESERRATTQSFVHMLVYPIYERWQRMNPLSNQSYQKVQEDLLKAGEFDSKPEDIQIGQIANALIYPLFFTILGLFFGDYKKVFLGFGVVAGLYMYRQPLRVLKGKVKANEERLLQEFTRFVTVFLMQVSGNKTPFDALVEAIKRSKERSRSLRYYLNELESDLQTKGPERALRDFALNMNKPYVDRFVNNVKLMLNQAGGDPKELNLRLRETLVEMQNQLVDQKIAQMKLKARVPTYVSVLLMAVYMIVILGAGLLVAF